MLRLEVKKHPHNYEQYNPVRRRYDWKQGWGVYLDGKLLNSKPVSRREAYLDRAQILLELEMKAND